MRKDTGEWAIPGGMVDDGEMVSATLKREFSEEAMGNHNLSDESKKSIRTQLDLLFKNGEVVFKGSVFVLI
jgi:ADP-ribose pyrophosphatase